MKINYIFSKDPKNSTAFTVVRTKHSSVQYRTIILKLAEDNTSEKFKDLQKNDLLITFNDLLSRNQNNILVIDDVSDIDNLYQVTVTGLNTSIYEIDEFEDDEKLMVIARVEK